MTNGNQFPTPDIATENSSNRSSASKGNVPPGGDGLTRIAIGVLIGGTLGGIAAALTSRGATERINQTLQDLARTAKSTAENVSRSVEDFGNAVNSVAVNVNDTSKDVNDAVESVATNVSGTIKSAVSTVRGTAENVNTTVKTATNAVNTLKESASGIQEAAKQTIDVPSAAPTQVSDGETLYKLIPVNPPAK